MLLDEYTFTSETLVIHIIVEAHSKSYFHFAFHIFYVDFSIRQVYS